MVRRLSRKEVALATLPPDPPCPRRGLSAICEAPLRALTALAALLLIASGLQAQRTSDDPISSARRTVELPEPLRDQAPGSTLQLTSSLLANQLDLSLLAGVPAGERTEESLPLGLVAALERALEHNLGAQLQTSRVRHRESRSRVARSLLLPSFELVFEQRTDELNFDASAFSRFRPEPLPGEEVPSVSAFQFFDARVEARWRLFDRRAQLELRSARALQRAAAANETAVRSSLLLVAGNLYYRVALLERRAQVAAQRQSQAATFEALVQTGLENGLRTATEHLAAELARVGAERDADAARAELEKSKLRLARIVGLPLGQRFHLLDSVLYTPLAPLTLAEAVRQAIDARGDAIAVREELQAARAELAATRARRLPKVEIEADWGEIGPTASDRRATYGFAALATLPLLRGGELSAERLAAAERVRALELRAAALEASIYYQLAEGLIDERTADRGVQLAGRTVKLAARRVEEARSRFDAGVTDTLEVLEAEADLSSAQARELDALLAHRTAKGAIARALGLGERDILDILRAEVSAAPPRSDTGADAR